MERAQRLWMDWNLCWDTMSQILMLSGCKTDGQGWCVCRCDQEESGHATFYCTIDCTRLEIRGRLQYSYTKRGFLGPVYEPDVVWILWCWSHLQYDQYLLIRSLFRKMLRFPQRHPVVLSFLSLYLLFLLGSFFLSVLYVDFRFAAEEGCTGWQWRRQWGCRVSLTYLLTQAFPPRVARASKIAF